MTIPANSTLVVATGNTHKTDEIRQIIGSAFGEVLDLRDFPGVEPDPETGTTFEANARIKAESVSRQLPGETLVLADDSGLEVDALGGAPGVYSARYSGENATDDANRAKLLDELDRDSVSGKDRAGRFRCVLALAMGGETIATFDGAVEGYIANKEKGEHGFGYDPLFIPKGYCKTFGQLPSETKHQLSHRGQALAKLKAWLGTGE